MRLSEGATDSVFFEPWDGVWSVLAVDPDATREWRFEAGAGARPAFRPAAMWSELTDLVKSDLPEDLAGWPADLGTPPAFRGGIAGTLGYGARLSIEHLPDRHASASGLPHARISRYPAVAAHHGPSGRWFVLGDVSRAAGWEARLSTPVQAPRARVVGGVSVEMSDAAYAAMVRSVREAIAAGDIFQANVARRWSGTVEGDPLAFYPEVRAVNPSPWGCVHRAPDWCVLSNSPELLLKIRDGRAETRPIAGTHPRGTGAQDDALRQKLSTSLKERAEHLMLLDLARNDLGRFCRLGSVSVPRTMGLEAYSHVWHIVSTVTGEMDDGRTAIDGLRAMFPCGTITGAPRIRCMEIIDELEPVPRGFYTGSTGWISFSGDAEWNVLIRTATAIGQNLSLHAGAGIVWDSDPTREARETVHKASAWLAALGGA